MLIKNNSFWVLSLILVATCSSVVYCSPCTCGSGSTDISTLSLFDLLSCLFDQEYQETALLKYDRVSDEWVTDCPVVENCLYGVDEGDEDICPSCYHGSGDVCGPWIGYCDVTSDLVCQYGSDYAAQGVCVSYDDYSHKQLGETCGDYEGTCDEGLHCMFTSQYYDGEAGMCVRNEDFFTGELGDDCNQRTSGCKDDLICDDAYFYTSTCQEASNETHTYLDLLFQTDDGYGEFEIIVEIDDLDESLLDDEEFLEELILEVEEMVYFEALLTMDDDDLYSTMYMMTEDITDSFFSDFSWEDDEYGAYFEDIDHDSDKLDIEEKDLVSFDENKVHVSDEDFDISDNREYAKKEFCVL